MNNFLLLASNTATTGGFNSWFVILEVVALGLLLYFMMIRPQKKQQKKAAEMLSAISTGDSVLTSSGFYGVVIDVMEDIVIIEFGNNKNCRIPMKKSAIIEIEKPNTEKSV